MTFYPTMFPTMILPNAQITYFIIIKKLKDILADIFKESCGDHGKGGKRYRSTKAQGQTGTLH